MARKKATKKPARKAAKKVAKRAPKAERIPRYKDETGMHLIVSEELGLSYDYCLQWYDPADDIGGEGATVGENDGTDESKVINKALLAFMEANPDRIDRLRDGRFTFASAGLASKALRISNAALWAWKKGQPLPDWQQKALAEDWTPPKGWHQ